MLFVVVFVSSLFFFSSISKQRTNAKRFCPGEEEGDDATKMEISFVSFPPVVLVEAADAAQEAEKGARVVGALLLSTKGRMQS